jgi:glycosyltransferase involved in cell wall biosynthesis
MENKSINRICILTTSFPRWQNDNRSPFLLEFAKALSVENKEVTVVAMHAPGAAVSEIIENISVIRLRYLPDKGETLQETRAGIPASLRKNSLSIISVFIFVIRMFIYLLFNGKTYDLIHSQWTIASLAAFLYKPLYKGKIVNTFHGSDIHLASNRLIFRAITKMIINKSDKNFCVSSSLKLEIVKWGIRPEKINVIPNGININRLNSQPIERKKTILFVGSLTKNKNVDLLIRSFSKVVLDYPDFELIVVGDGDELGNLKEIARHLNLELKVSFLGSLSPEEVIKHMYEAYLFVLPSVNEGFGVVLIEAMATGLPCIGTRSGGITDIITDSVGALFEPYNEQQLSQILINLIADKVLYTKFSSNSRKYIEENFQWQHIIKRYINEYRDISK